MAKAAAAGQATTETGTETADAKAAADAAAATAATEKAAADAKAKTDADAAAAAAGKTDDQKAGAADAAGKAGAGKTGEQPPVELKLTVPEGAEDLVSQAQLDYFTEVAKASGWSAEDAKAELTAHVDREKARIAAQSERWATETKADTEVGGDNLSTTQRNVKAALDRFLPESEPDGKLFRTALNTGGYGNWRPFVKLLARIGKAMGEDSPIAGKGAGPATSTEDVLYDHPTSKAGT